MMRYSLPPSAFASFEAPILLESTLALFASMEVLSLLSLPTSQSPPARPLLHCVHCWVWIGIWVELFEGRSAILSRIQHDRLLSTVLPTVFCLHRHQPHSLRIFPQRSVDCTCQRVLLTRRRVEAASLPLSFPYRCCWQIVAVNGVLGRREVFLVCVWSSRTIASGSQPASAVLCCLFYHFCIYELSVLCILFVFSVMVTQPVIGSFRLYHLLTALTDGLNSWYSCQDSLGSPFRMHCLRVLSFLVFIWVAQP
jgi:hypothetical protein